MTKLYGAPLSQPTRSVYWFALLNDIPIEYKIVRVDKGEQRTEEFKKLNPNMKIPVLDDDGFTIFERYSNFINF
jgi:glutathione S-transferase